MEFEPSTFLAVWGAILSTFLGILKAVDFFHRDKVRIKVIVRGNYKVSSRSPYGNSNLVMVTVMNKGRRPVTLTKAALLLPRGNSHKYVMCLDSLTATKPVSLTEGQVHDYIFNEDELQKTMKVRQSQYVALVHDATEKRYWSHSWSSRLIKTCRIS